MDALAETTNGRATVAAVAAGCATTDNCPEEAKP